MTTNKELMQQSLQVLQGRWGTPIAVAVLYCVIVMGVSMIPYVGTVLSIVVGAPLVLGFYEFFLKLSRGEEVSTSILWTGFSFFDKSVLTYLLMFVYVLLWSLLLIVPGIIASISYGMAFFILAEDKNLTPAEVLRRSKQMMYGYKWKYFCLGLRFIGWILLCIVTFGIGFLFLMPYMQTAYAKFYDDIKSASIPQESNEL
ncbi:MAG TPA: DUF975 family protein [Paludibacteraceae bacterium]|nr:DUF975 family protein [Paludibacteraceae bacterium]